MKTLSLVPLCLAATLFLGPAVHAAEQTSDTATRAAPAPGGDRQAAILKRFDKNGDGKLDETEKAEAKREMQKRRGPGGGGGAGKLHDRVLQMYDKNGDGVLDETERAAAVADFENRPRALKRFDKDGDGKLNAEEKAAAEQTLREQFAAKKQ